MSVYVGNPICGDCAQQQGLERELPGGAPIRRCVFCATDTRGRIGPGTCSIATCGRRSAPGERFCRKHGGPMVCGMCGHPDCRGHDARDVDLANPRPNLPS